MLVSAVCYFRSDRYMNSLNYLMVMLRTRALEPVYERDLFDGALNGMLETLDDNSSYFLPKSYKEFDEALRQEIGGIGAIFRIDETTQKPTISFTLPDTPARKAGLLPEDQILAVAGHPAEGLSVDRIRELLDGEVGTAVAVDIFRPASSATSQTLHLSIQRSRIRVETVEGFSRTPDGSWEYFLPAFFPAPAEDASGEMTAEKEAVGVPAPQTKIAYVKLTSFGEHTATELKNTLLGLKKRGMAGLVLDLRDNTGGLLDAANKVCDLFLDQGVIVSTRGRDGVELKTFMASPSRILDKKTPIVVLINHLSASASEIVAACIQDHAREGELNAVCVGTRTFGKGTVQELIALGPLPNDHPITGGSGDASEGNVSGIWDLWQQLWKKTPRAAVRITVASYWRPSGKNIHRFTRGNKKADESEDWGVLPDPGMEVEFPRTARGSVQPAFQKTVDTFSRKRFHGILTPTELEKAYDVDPQLKKGVEWLNTQSL